LSEDSSGSGPHGAGNGGISGAATTATTPDRRTNPAISSSDDEDEEVGEDPRIAKLYGLSDKTSPEDYVAKLDELGTAGALVLGGMCTVAETARMHFVAMSLLDADEDTTLAQCIDEKRAKLKAACAGGADPQVRFAAFLAALESFVLHLDEDEGQREANVAAFDQSLKLLWEWEIVDEEALRTWQQDERAARYLQVAAADAIRLREGPGQAFLDWVDAGES